MIFACICRFWKEFWWIFWWVAWIWVPIMLFWDLPYDLDQISTRHVHFLSLDVKALVFLVYCTSSQSLDLCLHLNGHVGYKTLCHTCWYNGTLILIFEFQIAPCLPGRRVKERKRELWFVPSLPEFSSQLSMFQEWWLIEPNHSEVPLVHQLSLIHIWRCRRSTLCRSRWSPYH